MDFYTPPSSQIKIKLMALEDVAKYISNSLPVFGFIKRGGGLKYDFKYSKAFWHSFIQLKFFICWSVLKNKKHLFVDLEINQLREAIWPISFWISYFVVDRKSVV